MELDIPTIIFEILNFLVLTIFLYFLLFRRVMRRVRERAQEKQRIIREMEAEREEAEQIRAELQARLDHIEQEISELVIDARERLDEEHKKIIQAARNEANRILKEARSEGEQLQQKALHDFRDQLLDTIFHTTEDVLRRVTPPEAHDRLVEELNQRIWDMGSEDMDMVETVRRSLGERSPTARIETARKLSPEQQAGLMKTLSALIDRDVELEIEKKPDLLAGIWIRVGDTVIDNSIAAQLQDLRSETEEDFEARLPHG